MMESPGLRALISGDADQSAIFAAARREGMRTLRESGVQKVLRGVTTVAEVLRVTMRDAGDEAREGAATSCRGRTRSRRDR